MYKHYQINRATSNSRRIVIQLFEIFFNEPMCLPSNWANLIDQEKSPQSAKVICDYIAGMTDRFAIKEHSSLYNFKH